MNLSEDLYSLKNSSGELVGVCGVHVDDIIGGGTPEMDAVLSKMRQKLPFGDYRTYTIRYTGIEIRQDPQSRAIEIGQEGYIDSLEPVQQSSMEKLKTACRMLP